MNITSILTATLLTSCFVCLSLAEDRPGPRAAKEPQSIVTEKSAGTYERPVTPIARASRRAVDAPATSEVFGLVIVPAGQTVSLDSTMDYSSANTVAVSVLCIICNSATTSLGNSGLVLQARWLVSDAELYATTENMAATSFPYTDAGGAVFNVYGAQFRLTLQNKGTQTIAIQQITMFRRSQ
jgi:hypothetical protein